MPHQHFSAALATDLFSLFLHLLRGSEPEMKLEEEQVLFSQVNVLTVKLSTVLPSLRKAFIYVSIYCFGKQGCRAHFFFPEEMIFFS